MTKLNGWQPIETAPRDAKILVYGYWRGELSSAKEYLTIEICEYEKHEREKDYCFGVCNSEYYYARMKGLLWHPLPELPEEYLI